MNLARTVRRSRASMRTWILLGVLAATCAGYTVSSHPSLASASSAEQGQHDGVRVSADGTLQLRTDAPAPPTVATGYTRYGFYVSPVQPFRLPTSAIRVRYESAVPAGSAVQIALRGSTDGQTWTSWETNLANETIVRFPQAVRIAQYRAILLGTDAASPALYAVDLQAVSGVEHRGAGDQSPAGHATQAAGPAVRSVQQQTSDQVAPTFRVRGTRMGMVGGRTANGHIIRPRDHFVSLPSWRSLSSRGGYEYQVRITYKGRSAVAPVWDVGPWNTRDDYWSVDRERYKELRRGWPQDHAAYFEGHNGGYAEKGYVRFPTAIDVGDGVWWDELGIVGDQAELEVTFLWLGRDPLAEPPPPAASEVIVDDEGPAFHPSASIWYHGPLDCGAGGHAFWTLTTTNSAESENHARWQPPLTAEALYDVYVHVPVCASPHPITRHARYLVQHRDGTHEVVVDQSRQTGWVLLGQFPFAGGDGGFVQLTDLAGDSMHTIWFDDAKWVPATQNPGS